MWDLPGPGLEPVSPALAGGFLTTVPPGKSHLSIDLTKGVKDLYTEHHRTLLKEIQDLIKRKNTPCSWIRTLNIYKMAVHPKLIYSFNTAPIMGPRIAQTILRKEEQTWKTHNTQFQKLLQIKPVWYWCEERHIDQWNRIESPEINPNIYDHLIFDEGAKTIQWDKE